MIGPVGSRSISVGHAIAESGDACITMDFSPGTSSVALSPKGARLIARQLLEWAQHADDWMQKSPEHRTQDWIQFKNQTFETAIVYKEETPDARLPER